MKPYFILLFLAAFIASCTKQSKTPPPVPSTAQAPAAAADNYPKVEAKGKTSTQAPTNIVRNAMLDRAGNVWFATWQGAVKYDGKQFTYFTETDGLGYIHVFSLLEDRKGNIWWGTIGGGVCRFDGKSTVKFTPKEGLGNDTIMCMLEDNAGNIWFSGRGGVCRYNGKTFTNFTTANGLVDNRIYAMVQANDGAIWFGGDDGVCYYNGKDFIKLKNTKEENVPYGYTRAMIEESVPYGDIRAMIKDRSGNIWIGSGYGVYKYDGKTFIHITEKQGLPNNVVYGMAQDKEGYLWFASNGATRYDGKVFINFTEKDGLCSKTVFCLLPDNAGNIWIGTVDNGICKYDGKTFVGFDKSPAK